MHTICQIGLGGEQKDVRADFFLEGGPFHHWCCAGAQVVHTGARLDRPATG